MLVALLALTTGCGAPPGPGPAVVEPPYTSLVVEVVDAPAAAPRRTTLTCRPPGGDHPDPARTCGELARQPQPFAPVPADATCSQLYGGPRTATVRGTYRAQPVELELSRADGCRIAQWDRLVPLLPAAGPS